MNQFEMTAAKVSKDDSAEDAPTQASMRESSSDKIRRNPTTDQLKARRQIARQGGSPDARHMEDDLKTTASSWWRLANSDALNAEDASESGDDDDRPKNYHGEGDEDSGEDDYDDQPWKKNSSLRLAYIWLDDSSVNENYITFGCYGRGTAKRVADAMTAQGMTGVTIEPTGVERQETEDGGMTEDETFIIYGNVPSGVSFDAFSDAISDAIERKIERISVLRIGGIEPADMNAVTGDDASGASGWGDGDTTATLGPVTSLKWYPNRSFCAFCGMSYHTRNAEEAKAFQKHQETHVSAGDFPNKRQAERLVDDPNSTDTFGASAETTYDDFAHDPASAMVDSTEQEDQLHTFGSLDQAFLKLANDLCDTSDPASTGRTEPVVAEDFDNSISATGALADECDLRPLHVRVASQFLGRSRRTATRHEAMPAPADLGVNVGDIFYNSWGYDQTNIDYYKVVRLTPAGVEVVPIGQKFISRNGPGGDTVVPDPNTIRDWDVITGIGRSDAKKSKVCRLRDYGNGPVIVLSSDHTAWKWNGNAQYQTDTMFGH